MANLASVWRDLKHLPFPPPFDSFPLIGLKDLVGVVVEEKGELESERKTHFRCGKKRAYKILAYAIGSVSRVPTLDT